MSRRAEPLHETEAAILGLIEAAAPLSKVLARVALRIEELVPDAMASIVLLNADGATFGPCVGPSLPQEYNDLLPGLQIGPRAGSCGTAMFRGETVIVSDIAADPLWEDCRAAALAFDLRACWSSPIKNSRGNVLGSFALYYRTPRPPARDEINLIDRFASVVALAIEHVRTVESLRDSDERFRQLAENIEEVVWMRDPASGDILYVSPAYERIWGRSCAALYRDPDTWIAAVHKDDLPRVQASLGTLSAGRFADEYRVVRPDGEIRWVIDRGFPVSDASGRVYRVVGTARDVTERKQAERALRESEQRFQAISAATADLIWDWDLQHDSMWWSGDFEQVFGYPEGSVASGERWLSRVHPEDRERVGQSIQGAIQRGGPSWQEEYRFLHRDGRVFEVEDRGRIILGEDGLPTRFVGGMTDITERKRSQRELRERIKELRCLYRVLDFTSDAARPVGEICDDVAQTLPQSLMHDDVAMAQVGLEDSTYPSHSWRKPVASLRVPILCGGSEAGFVEIGYGAPREDQPDGSGPFLAEEHAMVEAVAAHLGRMLDRRRMSEKLTQAERLGAIGELTGGIAHDFNNLLTIILGNAEMLAADLADRPGQQRLAQMLIDAAERGADLTRQMLAFARRQPLSPAATALAFLLDEMNDLLRRTLGEHIDIAVIRGDDLWPAQVDPTQFESAVLNLCINARDAMPDGGRLTIELSNVRLDDTYTHWAEDFAPGDYVLTAVSDTGIGMNSDVLSRAFEPFFTTKDVGRGSGLGLSMVYGFVRQSHGHVRIYSEPEQGTTVKLYLPRADVPAGTDQGRAANMARLGNGQHILLVEDDAAVRNNAAGLLDGLGYVVITAANAPEALELLRQDRAFDLLFTDVVMPGGMNGHQLAAEAQRLRPGLPILFTSGYTENAILRQGRLDAGIHLLNKPYRRAELAMKVHEMLGGAG
ncbi:MAG: PAS domain-containing protein [Alphaproteobacteria bacterium]